MGTRLRTSGRTKTATTTRIKTKVEQVARTITTVTEQALADIQQAYLNDIDLIEEETDYLEADDLQDSGDSEAILTGLLVHSVGDVGLESPLPSLRQLPSSARPPVRYLIEPSFEVRRLDGKSDKYSNLSHLIANAIARHLKNNNVELSNPGDWRHIPAIGSDDNLRELINEDIDQKHELQVIADMKSYGARAKDFAVIFSNGDVVAAQTLITRAQTGMRATDGAFLRASALQEDNSPFEISGEQWTARNIEVYQKKIKERKSRQKKATKESRPQSRGQSRSKKA